LLPVNRRIKIDPKRMRLGSGKPTATEESTWGNIKSMFR